MRPAGELLGASSDRRHQQNLIAFLKRIRRSTEEANIFLIDVDIQEAADLTLVVAQVRLKIRELLVEHGEEFAEISRCARNGSDAVSVAPQGSWNVHGDGHRYAPIASASCAAATAPGTSSTSRLCCRYASNSTNFGAIGRPALYTPASTSVVFRPFPVTH